MTERDPSLSQRDPEIAVLIRQENLREHASLRLIASENYASRAVMEATGSCLTNKYSEGYPHKRYYEGQQVIDEVEELAKARVGQLFFRNREPPWPTGISTSTCSRTRGARQTSRSISRFSRPGTRSWGSVCLRGGT